MRKYHTNKDKHMAKMSNYREYFDKYKYMLNDELSNDQNIKILINKAIDIQINIGGEYKNIINDTHLILCKEVDNKINITTWRHMLKCACSKKKNYLTKKRMSKMRSKIDDYNYINLIYSSFYDSFCERDEYKMVKRNKAPKLKYTAEDNEKIKNLINDTADKIINEIDPKLKVIGELAKVAYFISNGDCTIQDFSKAISIAMDYMDECKQMMKLYEKFAKFNEICDKFFPEIKQTMELSFNIHTKSDEDEQIKVA